MEGERLDKALSTLQGQLMSLTASIKQVFNPTHNPP